MRKFERKVYIEMEFMEENLHILTKLICDRIQTLM